MRHPDYDRAFHDAPDYIHSAIELGMRKGEQRMKRRRKYMRALAVAAALAVILGAGVFGASQLTAPKPDNRVASQPKSAPTGEGSGSPVATFVTPEGTKLPEPTPEDTPTPTPEPTPTSEPAFPKTVYYTQGGRYFHIERTCSGLENGIEGSVNEAYHAGKEPCPICLTGWSFEVNAVPEITPEPTPEPIIETEAESADAEPAAGIEVAEAEFEYAYLGLSPEDAVYCAPGDDRFHFNANCPELKGQVTVLTTLGAAMRDHGVCEECKPMEAAVVYNSEEGVMRSAATGDILVYYNPNGTYFHVQSDCSGMRGAQLHTLQEAVEARKFHCPVCIGDQEKLYWLDVPAEDDDPVYTSPYSGYYHRSGDCFHLPSVAIDTYGAVRGDGVLAPCPHCLPELAGAFDSPLCYAADGDRFYHASPRCKNISNSGIADMSELQAQAEGLRRCPDCADERAAMPEYGEMFEELTGRWLGEAYHGWIFERADVRADGSMDWYVSTEEDIAPNPRLACRVTAERGGEVSFELGGDAMDMCISHDFLNALPEAILRSCDRDAPGAIRDAMETPDEAQAEEVFDNVERFCIEAGAEGEIAAFELEFRAPDGNMWFGGNAIALRWQSANGGFELSGTEILGKG